LIPKRIVEAASYRKMPAKAGMPDHRRYWLCASKTQRNGGDPYFCWLSAMRGGAVMSTHNLLCWKVQACLRDSNGQKPLAAWSNTACPLNSICPAFGWRTRKGTKRREGVTINEKSCHGRRSLSAMFSEDTSRCWNSSRPTGLLPFQQHICDNIRWEK